VVKGQKALAGEACLSSLSLGLPLHAGLIRRETPWQERSVTMRRTQGWGLLHESRHSSQAP
jgi:hypothetical protein